MAKESNHQYRHMKSQAPMCFMEMSIPRLIPFLKGLPNSGYDQMFGHELAHALELVDRGQIERLKLDNFGWPRGVFGHTPKTATTECRVFALQYLLEEEFLGHQSGDILSLSNSCIFLATPNTQVWRSVDQCRAWLKECKPERRIHGFMEEYRPRLKPLLDKTVNYLVDECAEFM